MHRKADASLRTELNIEEINDLVYLIMHGDWDYVYNEAVLITGHNRPKPSAMHPAATAHAEPGR